MFKIPLGMFTQISGLYPVDLTIVTFEFVVTLQMKHTESFVLSKISKRPQDQSNIKFRKK